VASIFVNPIQFNNPDDLKHYPRTLERDLQLLEAQGCDMAFVPSVDEMYPEKTTREFDFGHLDKVMEGRYRPGHFNGVAIVVERLFDIVKPNRAYFGQKDYQQLTIIQALVRMLELPVEIIPCPTVREADGLAMSSRNVRLTPAQRRLAPLIYQALLKVQDHFRHSGIKDIHEMVTGEFTKIPEMELEYFEIVDASTLLPVSTPATCNNCIACIAVYLGDVRLIDNILLN
jgi:pantoate--beta-alanine ligase